MKDYPPGVVWFALGSTSHVIPVKAGIQSKQNKDGLCPAYFRYWIPDQVREDERIGAISSSLNVIAGLTRNPNRSRRRNVGIYRLAKAAMCDFASST